MQHWTLLELSFRTHPQQGHRQRAYCISYPVHWVLQGRDTSKVAGLSCRSGRVVLAGDRNYNPVPITMILREHEDDIRGKHQTCLRCSSLHAACIAMHSSVPISGTDQPVEQQLIQLHHAFSDRYLCAP